MRQSLVSAALLAFVIPLSACLSYTPLGNVTPARGAEVVATVTPIDVRVGEITVHHVTRVEGRHDCWKPVRLGDRHRVPQRR